MGKYVTKTLDDKTYHEIIKLIRDGYSCHNPNPQIATILVLEANLGCRIGDIIDLRKESFIKDGGIWKINIKEQKTGKTRCFIVPQEIKDFIDKWADVNGITTGKLFNVTSQAVWKALRQVTDYLGLENISSHSFRKKAANTLYEKSGYDIEVVARFLNHSDIRTTRTYIARSDKQMEEAISKMVSLA